MIMHGFASQTWQEDLDTFQHVPSDQIVEYQTAGLADTLHRTQRCTSNFTVNMCMQVACDTCSKPTWRGCGRHIDEVYSWAHSPLLEWSKSMGYLYETQVRITAGAQERSSRAAMRMQS